MESIETLQELTELFSELMLGEFADNESTPGNRLITKHLKHKQYTDEQVETIRAVVYMDTQRAGW